MGLEWVGYELVGWGNRGRVSDSWGGATREIGFKKLVFGEKSEVWEMGH